MAPGEKRYQGWEIGREIALFRSWVHREFRSKLIAAELSGLIVEGFRRRPSWPLASDPSSFGQDQSPSPTLIEPWRCSPRPSGNRLVDPTSGDTAPG